MTASLSRAPGKPRRWGTSFSNGKLYVFTPESILVARPWPEVRAWRKTLGRTTWRSVRLELDLNSGVTGHQRRRSSHGSRLPYFEPAASQEPGWAIEPPEPSDPELEDEAEGQRARYLAKQAEQAAEAQRYFCQAFPPEVSIPVSQFGERQWHLCSMLARCPGSLDLVRNNPALAFCLANNWVFHQPKPTQPMRAARAWTARRQRDIAEWLGFPGTEYAVRLLRKVHPAACTIPWLLELRRLMIKSPFDKWLRDVPRLSLTTMQLLMHGGLRSMLTGPLLLELDDADREPQDVSPSARLLIDAHQMSRWLGEALPAPMRTLRQMIARHDELAVRIARTCKVDPTTPLPPPPLPGNESIIPLSTVGDLIHESLEQQNCTASYVELVQRRRVFIYRVCAPERATLSVVREQQAWRLGELLARNNAAVTADTKDAVSEWFHQAQSPVVLPKLTQPWP